MVNKSINKDRNKDSDYYNYLKNIQDMLKLIPNDFPVTPEDCEEIFSQHHSKGNKRKLKDA